MPSKFTFFLFLSLLINTSAWAGGIRGKVYNEAGEPLSYAAIYVKETGSGTTTNAEGSYELRLKPGDYTLVFQFLGYQTVVKEVAIGQTFKYLDITLPEQTLQLQEVDVVGSGEDPAYTVMRKAIAKASYHRQQLDRYQVEVYIKGSGRLKESPGLLRKAIEREGVDSTVAFTTESVSIVEYERPNTYREKVISIYTQGNDNDTSPNSFIQGSFYDPKIDDAVSPLSPRAFAYYKFKHEGYFIDRGYGVNKIRVIPRSRGEDVFEGLIYILEDYWSIHSLSLSTYGMGFEFNVDQVYAPIRDEVWMPVNQTFFVEGKVFGFGFEYQYLSAMSDYQITLNPDLDAEFEVVDETIEEVPATTNKEEQSSVEEKLSNGEELTRKELRKLMREYAKEERKAQEEPEVVENTSLEIDSLARKRDSTYWQTIRLVPLTRQEVKGYHRADSLAQVEAEEADSLERVGVNKDGQFNPLAIIGGGSYKIAEGHYLAHSAIWDKFSFNPVEGFNLHADFSYAIRKDNRFALTITPRYAFSRQKLTGKAAVAYTFGKELRDHRTHLEGGRYISQYNANNPISYFFNGFLNLIQKRNYIRLYEKDYLKLSHQHEIQDNWQLTASAEWAERYHLNNSTDWAIFNNDEREYESNTFINQEYNYPVPASEKAFVLGLSLEAQPWQKYRIRNGEKEPIENTSPTIRLHYRRGITGVRGSITDYQFAKLGFEHRFPIGVRGDMDLKVEAGHFFTNDYLGFADYQHFMGNQVSLISADPIGSYRLLPYYQYSTSDQFASVFAHYQFRKFALTQIPAVWLLGIKENVFVNYLATPVADNYTEVGYSIDNIFRLLRVEVAASFQNDQFLDWGIFLGISSNLGNGVFTVE